MEKYSMIVWTEPHAGQEDVYNDWYDNLHLAEVCSLPEITGAQRYVFSSEAMTPRKYLAIYDIETSEIDTFFARFSVSAERMNISPSLDTDSVILSIVRKL